MTIEELYRTFTDVDFRYLRFMKTHNFSRELVEPYDSLIETIRLQALKMDFSPTMNEELNALGRLDLDFVPKLSWVVNFFGFITFGYSKRKITRQKTKSYYLREIHQRHLIVQSIQKHLEEE